MIPPDERYRRGVEILQRLTGEALEHGASRVAEIAPDFARMTIEFPFGDLYSRAAVDLRTRELAAIAALAVLGRMKQLRVHVRAALHVGCSSEEVVEILMQIAIYAGFPQALDALTECHDILAGSEEEASRPALSQASRCGARPPCPPSARDSAAPPG